MSRAAIFYHGFLTDDKDFGELYDSVSEKYDEIVKYVFPGHKTPNDFSLFTEGSTFETAERAYDELRQKHDEIDVYGFSMGGAMATHIAKTRDPKKLVLLAPANKYLNFTFVIEQFKYQLKVASGLLKHPDKEKYKKIKDELGVYFENDKKGWSIFVRQLFPNYNYHTLTTFSKIIKHCNNGLTSIAQPTLVVWGKLDQFVPFESIKYLKEMLKNEDSKVKIYDDISHLMLYGKNAKEVIDEVVDFVK